MKKAAKIIIAAIIAYIIIFITDFTLVLNEKDPVFCIIKSSNETDLCDPQPKTEKHCLGLGYAYEIIPHPVTGKYEYALFIFGQLVSSNITNSIQPVRTDITPPETSAAETTVFSTKIHEAFTQDDFTFHAVIDRENIEITDETIKQNIWDMILTIESNPPVQLDENDSVGLTGGRLILKHRNENTEFTLSDGILYQNPNEDGGPLVIAISDGTNTSYYNSFYSDDGEKCYRVYEMLYMLNADPVPATSAVSETHVTERLSNIVVINSYKNDSDGYQHYGTFIDTYGKVYEFDFSDEKLTKDEDFTARLEEYYHSSDLSYCQNVSDPTLMLLIAGLSDMISPDAEITRENIGSGEGVNTVYVLDSHNKLIRLYAFGDYDETNTDAYAVKISDLCRIL